MTIIYIEADENEMRANRSVMETLSLCFNSIADKIAGVNVTDEMIAKAISNYGDDEKEINESEECE